MAHECRDLFTRPQEFSSGAGGLGTGDQHGNGRLGIVTNGLFLSNQENSRQRAMNNLGLMLRFIRRLPDFYILNRHIYLRAEQNLPVNVCIFDDRRWFYTPDDLMVHDMFVHHATSFYTRHEVAAWLRFASGCRSLLDAGASAGFFSAIFNRITDGHGKILSVEPDTRSHRMLDETIRLNSANGNWLSANAALSGKEGSAPFYSTGYGGGLGGVEARKETLYRGEQAKEPAVKEVRVETLDSLCSRVGFAPDLIKMDIESYEVETLLAASDFLKKFRPRLYLELHNSLIRGRGLDPKPLVQFLFSAGYRGQGASDIDTICSPESSHLFLVPG